MNKTELIAAVAEKADISKKDAEKAMKAFVEVVTEQLKNGDKVQVVGFGTFEVSERAAREGRNPHTGEAMTIAASKAPASCQPAAVVPLPPKSFRPLVPSEFCIKNVPLSPLGEIRKNAGSVSSVTAELPLVADAMVIYSLLVA